MQDRASERSQDQFVEEIKELEHKKTEEALQLAVKEHDLWMHQMKKKKQKNCWDEGRKLENGEWRLEPEGEAEVLEIIIVSDAVEGTPVDLDGESRHEQVEAKLLTWGREMLNEGEEIKSPRRKVIRVESEETEDL